MAVGLEELPAFWTLHPAQSRGRFFYGRGLALAGDWHLTPYFLFLHSSSKGEYLVHVFHYGHYQFWVAGNYLRSWEGLSGRYPPGLKILRQGIETTIFNNFLDLN